MEGGVVGHNFERDPPKDHPCQVWFNLIQGFQRRRIKCESLRRTPSDGKSSPGELKRCTNYIQSCTHLVILFPICFVLFPFYIPLYYKRSIPTTTKTPTQCILFPMLKDFETNKLWIHLISLVPIFVDWEKMVFRRIVKFVDCRLQKIKKKVLKYLNSWIFTSNS